MTSFDGLGLDAPILLNIEEAGYASPTPIQAQAIPPALAGKDLLVAAQTGSGKTAAFLLPIIQQLLHRPRTGRVRALVLTPTRELAAQIDEHVQMLGYRTPITGAAVYGGVGMLPQQRALECGADIIVATPGRLLDHLRFPYAKLDGVEFLILDEADRMLDMGFIPDIRRIIRTLPVQRQTMLFSATMPKAIVHLAQSLLKDPVPINIDRIAAPADGVRQMLYPVADDMKAELLVELLRGADVRSALVFTRTKHRASRLGSYLWKQGAAVEVIHGDRSQSDREAALSAFRRGLVKILVATDVAARGIDVSELSHVVNFDVPRSPDDYIHRVGRTARAKATGDAFTLVAPADEREIRAIEKAIGHPIPRTYLEGFTPKGDRRRDGAEAEASAPSVPARSAERGERSERKPGRNRGGRGRGNRRGASPEPASEATARPSFSEDGPSVPVDDATTAAKPKRRRSRGRRRKSEMATTTV